MMKTKSIVMTGMFTAILAVLSQIMLPMPSGVPVTLQTFAVALTGCVLGWRMGTMSVLIYIIAGAVGVPVFSGFTGGLGILFGNTGGFIFGFIFLVFLCGIGDKYKNKVIKGVWGVLGLLLCHLLGILQFMLFSNMQFAGAAMLVSLPYLIKDLISIAAGIVVGSILKKTLNAANILSYAKES